MPRRSLPAITNAFSTPSTGFSITDNIYCSYPPATALVSSLPRRAMSSISLLCPIVPAMTACRLSGESVITASAFSAPVAVMSPASSCAAFLTVMKSSGDTTTAALSPLPKSFIIRLFLLCDTSTCAFTVMAQQISIIHAIIRFGDEMRCSIMIGDNS